MSAAHPNQNPVVLEAVSKLFRHRPHWFNWIGQERAGETLALDNLSLTVAAGEVLAVLGPNGSGKTTLLKLISTLLLPDQGRVLVTGADTQREGDTARCAVGYTVASDRSFFPRLTARENLEFFAALDDVPRGSRASRITWALATVGLSSEADLLAMKFSSGMYQRLAIARALLKRPAVLLLDEPTRSIDAEGAVHLWSAIRTSASEGCAVLLATHNFEEAASLGHRMALLRDGRLVSLQRLGAGTSVQELKRHYQSEVETTPSVSFSAAGGPS